MRVSVRRLAGGRVWIARHHADQKSFETTWYRAEDKTEDADKEADR